MDGAVCFCLSLPCVISERLVPNPIGAEVIDALAPAVGQVPAHCFACISSGMKRKVLVPKEKKNLLSLTFQGDLKTSQSDIWIRLQLYSTQNEIKTSISVFFFFLFLRYQSHELSFMGKFLNTYQDL